MTNFTHHGRIYDLAELGKAVLTAEVEGFQRIDARGHHCPVPSLRLSRALRSAAKGDLLVLLASDPMARIDVPHLLQNTPHQILATESLLALDLSDTGLIFVVLAGLDTSETSASGGKDA